MNVGVGVTVQNVYYMEVETTGGVGDEDVLDDLGEFLEDGYTEMLAIMPNNVSFTEYKVTNVDADVEIGISGWPTFTVGGGSGDMLPEGLAGLVRYRTGDVGHEGRKFIGPLGEVNQTDGQLAAATVTALGDFGDETAYLYTATSGNQYQNKILDRTTAETRPTTEVVASSTPAYQRRRKPGRGI